MSKTLQSVSLLEEKLTKLLMGYEQLKKENELLEQKNKELQNLLKENQKSLAYWREEYNLLKIAKTIQGSTKGIRDTKLKINALIREIDKCIIQLNS